MAFSLDPEVIDECVRICDDMIDKLELGQQDARRLQGVSGFGEFESARQLARGYEAKGEATAQAIAAMREAIARTRQALIDVKNGAVETDADFAAMLAKNVQDLA